MTTSTAQMPEMVVTGHLVSITRPDGACKYLYRGEPVPDWISPEEFNHLISSDLIQLAEQVRDQQSRPTPPPVVDMPDMLVTGALVAIHNPAGQLVYAYQGTALPKWVNQVEYDNLLSLGYIEPTDADTYAAAPQPTPYTPNRSKKGTVR